jgi:hypothetical protein
MLWVSSVQRAKERKIMSVCLSVRLNSKSAGPILTIFMLLQSRILKFLLPGCSNMRKRDTSATVELR